MFSCSQLYKLQTIIGRVRDREVTKEWRLNAVSIRTEHLLPGDYWENIKRREQCKPADIINDIRHWFRNRFYAKFFWLLVFGSDQRASSLGVGRLKKALVAKVIHTILENCELGSILFTFLSRHLSHPQLLGFVASGLPHFLSQDDGKQSRKLLADLVVSLPCG